MSEQWVSAAMTTGRIVGDLTGYQPDYPFRRTLSNYDTATGRLYLNEPDGRAGFVAPPDWPNLVKAGARVLALYDDGDKAKGIQWAGYVTKATPDDATDSVELSLTTVEGYLARRYAGDLDYLVQDGWTVAGIVNDLIARYIVDGAGGRPGIPLLTHVVGTSPAITDDITWMDADNAKVLERIQTLFQLYGGEFAVEWAWSADNLSLVPTLNHGPQIGTTPAAGIAPAVTFEPPAITALSMPTDYGDGAGANVVVAYSSGQGASAPTSTPVVASNFDGRPTFEQRISPSTTVDSDDALDQAAQKAFAVLSPGAQPLSATLANDALDTGQRLGTDWRMGDTIGIRSDPTLAFPQGVDTTGRVIAIEKSDLSTTTPIFADPNVYGGES